MFIGDGDKENSVLTAPTNTRMTLTAPTKLLKNIDTVNTPSVPKLLVQDLSQKPNINTLPCSSTINTTKSETADTSIEHKVAESKCLFFSL